jgi:hypothetical protein
MEDRTGDEEEEEKFRVKAVAGPGRGGQVKAQAQILYTNSGLCTGRHDGR